MLARFRKWLEAPTFEDRALTNQARSLNVILLFMFVLTFLYLPYALLFPPQGQAFIAMIALAVEAGLWFLLRSGRIRLAGILLSALIWVAILLEEIIFGGVRDTGFTSFAIVIVIASLTVGFVAGTIFAVLTILAGIGLIVAENMQLLAPLSGASSSSALISHSITFVAILLLLYLAVRSLTISSKKVIDDEKATREINQELEKSRTELHEHAQQLERRTAALEAVTQIGHLFNQTKDEKVYLKEAVELLARRLPFDKISVYLLDEAGENAILRAHAGDMPIQTLQVTHSKIGYGYQSGETLSFRIGSEAYYITPPGTLEGMHATLNIPIETGTKMLGLINIQASGATLPKEDVAVLEIVADQIANALENIRMFSQLQGRLLEIEQLAGQATQSGWRKVEAGTPLRYEYDRIQILPGKEEYPQEVVNQLLQGKSATFVTRGIHRTSRLVAPIILRNQVLGMIGYEEDNPNHVWEPDSILVLETIATQVSLALENTRLIAEAQERARQEKLISNAASRMRETLDIDIILQTAVREMRDAFSLNEAEIRLHPIPEETGKE